MIPWCHIYCGLPGHTVNVLLSVLERRVPLTAFHGPESLCHNTEHVKIMMTHITISLFGIDIWEMRASWGHIRNDWTCMQDVCVASSTNNCLWTFTAFTFIQTISTLLLSIEWRAHSVTDRPYSTEKVYVTCSHIKLDVPSGDYTVSNKTLDLNNPGTDPFEIQNDLQDQCSARNSQCTGESEKSQI